jgi:hypothetical protein
MNGESKLLRFSLIGKIRGSRTKGPTIHKTLYRKPTRAAGLSTYKPGALPCKLKCRAAVRAADWHQSCDHAPPSVPTLNSNRGMVCYRVPGVPPPGEQMVPFEALCPSPKADECRSYLV